MSPYSDASTSLPDPPVPADIDVDGIHGFLLHTDRLFHSELWALSAGEEFRAAVALGAAPGASARRDRCPTTTGCSPPFLIGSSTDAGPPCSQAGA